MLSRTIEHGTYVEMLVRARQHAPALADAIEAIGPIEIAPSPHASVADQLFVEIINQQLSLRAADTIWGRVRVTAEEGGLSIRDLFTEEHDAIVRACGVSGRKAKALKAVRTAEVAGLLDDAELASMAHEERAARLTSIWGIGRWTADMLGIFFFADNDIWPDGDVAVVGTMHRITGSAAPSQIAADFAPYRSILARYLWRHRDSSGKQCQPKKSKFAI